MSRVLEQDPNTATGAWLSIGDVSRATGIPVDTLRTWERRYGMPRAVRLPSGHRRYPISVVGALRAVAEAVAQGHRAASVLQMAPADIDLLLGRGTERRQILPAAEVDDARVAALLDATGRLDGAAIERAVLTAVSERGLLAALETVVAPFLVRLGEAWAAGRVGVAQEHHASERLMAALTSLWHPAADATDRPAIVLAALPGEQHVLGLHMAAAVAAETRFRVLFLGHDMPLAGIVETARATQATAVVCSASSASDPATTRALAERLRRELPAGATVLLGGAGAPTEADGVEVVGSLYALRARLVALASAPG